MKDSLAEGRELLAMLRHSIHGGERNYYCATTAGIDGQRCQVLEGLGLMRLGRTINEGRDAIFHVTEMGRLAAAMGGSNFTADHRHGIGPCLPPCPGYAKGPDDAP